MHVHMCVYMYVCVCVWSGLWEDFMDWRWSWRMTAGETTRERFCKLKVITSHKEDAVGGGLGSVTLGPSEPVHGGGQSGADQLCQE